MKAKQVQLPKSICWCYFCCKIKRLIPHSTRALKDRVVGYLLFSRLELKLPMIIFHTGFLSGHNINLFSFFLFLKE
jgi:hypothetical protein